MSLRIHLRDYLCEIIIIAVSTPQIFGNQKFEYEILRVVLPRLMGIRDNDESRINCQTPWRFESKARAMDDARAKMDAVYQMSR